MNRQILTLAAVAAALVLAGALYLVLRTPGGPPEPGGVPITGAERAEEARGIIAEIEQSGAAQGGAGAMTPSPPAEQPGGAPTVVPEGPAGEESGTAAIVPAPAGEESGTGAIVPAPAGEESGTGAVTPVPGAEASSGDPDLDAAYERAQAFQEAGQLADAQVLFFYAARGGHAGAAFNLGTMNDPNHHSPEISLLPEPDAFQAYRWYSAARDQGVTAASERLEALREWAQAASATGDFEAERLLLQWE